MKIIIVITGIIYLAITVNAALPPDYRGRPFNDSVYKTGPQIIPGRIECAYFDFGGEGIAYHSDGTNHGSGELNLKPEHHRPHATPYIWQFRTDEGVSVSYTKDFADFNHKTPVPFSPETNQLYVGWTKDGQWLNYTINVKVAGTYKVRVLYSGNPTNFIFSLNHRLAGEYKIPVRTSGMHTWNRAEVGTITFPETGLQLLTFDYNAGNNFAYFDFELVERPYLFVPVFTLLKRPVLALLLALFSPKFQLMLLSRVCALSLGASKSKPFDHDHPAVALCLFILYFISHTIRQMTDAGLLDLNTRRSYRGAK